MTKHVGTMGGTLNAKMRNIIGALIMDGHTVTPVGSRAVANYYDPNWDLEVRRRVITARRNLASNSDFDFLVSPCATEWDLKKLTRNLKSKGFEVGGSLTAEQQEAFVSFKTNGAQVHHRRDSAARPTNPVANLILCKNQEYHESFITAQDLCEKMGITDKSSRVAIHEFLRKGDKSTYSGEDFAKALENKYGELHF